MVRSDTKSSLKKTAGVFNYSYVVLGILLLLTAGTTLAYYQNAHVFADESGMKWTPVVFLIGLCISLVIFGMTYREATARMILQQKTIDLIEAQKQNKELLEIEQELRLAAERANSAKDEFLAVVSHELKTPLNAIAGWTRILKTPGISDETRETAMEKIDKNLRIQAGIVEELLNFSDLMSCGGKIARRPVIMRAIFEEAVASVTVAAFQKGVTLASEAKLDGERIMGDSERLRTALVNVLSNAVKYTPSGGSIEATAYMSNDCVHCVVTDTGLGIPAEFLPYVFEQYKQSERFETRHHGGLGLGLTIAQHVIQLHGGSITAESPGVGLGATFTICLPTNPRMDSLQESLTT